MRSSRAVSFSEEGGFDPSATAGTNDVSARTSPGNFVRQRQSPSNNSREFSSPLLLIPRPNSRSNTPTSYTYQELARRPRSNPRNRTPMRQESPIAATSNMIRIGNNFTRGTTNTSSLTTSTALNRLRSSDTPVEDFNNTKNLSAKQGPSYRKVRRWNNDRFAGIASDIHNPKLRSQMSTLWNNHDGNDELIQLPIEYENSFSKLSKEEKEQFLTYHPTMSQQQPQQPQKPISSENSQSMWLRIDPRLKNILLRACKSSTNQNVLFAFESILLHHSSSSFNYNDGAEEEETKATENNNDDDDDESKSTWEEKRRIMDLSTAQDFLTANILLQPPLATTMKDQQNRVNVRFLFPETSSKGAYHRMFLHSICQFHGWNATSTNIQNKGRLLTVNITKRDDKKCDLLLQQIYQQYTKDDESTQEKNSKTFVVPNISALTLS